MGLLPLALSVSAAKTPERTNWFLHEDYLRITEVGLLGFFFCNPRQPRHIRPPEDFSQSN
jgi:hypothetical protein